MQSDSNSKKGKSKFARIFSKVMSVAAIVCFIALSIAFFVFGNVVPPRIASGDIFLFLFLFFGIVLMAFNIVYFAWQMLLVYQYRQYPSQENDSELPTVSVIVPAFNEGKLVRETLEGLLTSDYPRNKLEIITVNDGSLDDTWNWIYTAVEGAGGRIIAVDLPKNAGKRNALYKGLLIASSEIIVTLDSDSKVTPQTLRCLVAPFHGHPEIGGVAGNIRVLNTHEGIIPRMLDVSFVFSFEFLKSAQSCVHTVLCQPGALSAFRRSVILPYTAEWVNESFFGHPAIIGEDRALTNILLREGWKVVFQRDAVTYSEMPTSYLSLCKMMIRWTRGNFRENFVLFKYVFKKIDLSDDDLTGMQLNLIAQTFWQISPIVFSVFAVWSIFTGSFAFVSGMIVSIIFWSTLPAFIYAGRYSKKESLWSYVYGFLSFVTMFWVAPYSVLTVNNTNWLTRQK